MLKQMIRGALAVFVFFLGGFCAQYVIGSKLSAPTSAIASSQVPTSEPFDQINARIADLNAAIDTLGGQAESTLVMLDYLESIGFTDTELLSHAVRFIGEYVPQPLSFMNLVVDMLESSAQELEALYTQAKADLEASKVALEVAKAELEAKKAELAAANTDLAAANADLNEISRLMGLPFGTRRSEPNNGKTASGRAAIARILTTP